MTAKHNTKKSRKHLPNQRQLMFGLMCAFSMMLILRNSDAAIEYIGNGLKICVRTVIPSLFPFMVLSELIVSSGLGELAGRCLDRPLGWIFGISGVSATAVILGTLCGFPVGARTAVALYENSSIDKREVSRLLTFCNNPSSAFIISAVGASLYSNRKLGMALYAVTIANSVVIGVCQRFFYPVSRSPDGHKLKIYPSGIDAFTSSVTRSAQSMLSVCSYVVFFSAIIGCLSGLLDAIGTPPLVSAFLYGIVELSGGVSTSAALGTGIQGVCLTAFIVGWSGLSVHFQVFSVCSGRGLHLSGYLIAKLVQGIMNWAVIYALCRAIPSLLAPPAQGVATDTVASVYIEAIRTPWSAAVLVVFAAFLPFAATNILSKKNTDKHK